MKYDIAIIGGGIIGQAFAIAMMKKSNLNIAIIEPNEPNPKLSNSFHIRTSAINLASEKFLKNIGVWDLIKRKNAFTSTKVWDQNSPGNLNFSAKDKNLNHLGHIIENDYIQSAMFEILSKKKVKFISSKLQKLQKINQGYNLKLENNSELSCDLLIAADGRFSKVIELSNIGFNEINYQQKSITCIVKTNKTLQNTSWQRFLSDSIVALLPLNDNTACAVWSTENSYANKLIKLEPEEFADKLAACTEYRFGSLKVISLIKHFDLIARHAKEYVRENLALIGDAAHSIHPLAGQGLNLGIADVKELSKQILMADDKILGDYFILHKYQKARKFDNEVMSKTMTTLNYVYKNNNEITRWLRGFGMNFIDKNKTLKMFFQKQATGKS
jgi:2-octaprenyl-3-methyl-6-methoxy-1,4-benzoquinol hydroxylase/2-octaprenylphenol hydroxylase